MDFVISPWDKSKAKKYLADEVSQRRVIPHRNWNVTVMIKNTFVSYSNFPVIHPQGISWQKVSIGSSNGLAPNRWQAAITWTNDCPTPDDAEKNSKFMPIQPWPFRNIRPIHVFVLPGFITRIFQIYKTSIDASSRGFFKFIKLL